MSTSSVMRILSSQGDTAITFDYAAAKGGDLQAAQAVAAAERIFTEKRAQGYRAFRFIYPQRAIERLSAFDPQAREILIVPPVAGG